MAITSTKEYITHRNLKDIYPGLSEYDTKKRIYGWVQETQVDDYGGISNLNVWYVGNTGLVTKLYKNGIAMESLTSNVTTEKTQVSVEFPVNDFSIDVDSSTGFALDDIFKIGSEYFSTSSAPDGTTIACVSGRSLFSTTQDNHKVDASVYHVVDSSENEQTDYNWFFYDSALDLCVVTMPSDTNPNDYVMDSGEDWSTLVTRMIRRASRMVESLLDSRQTREIMKDREGNYPEFIQRAVGLKAITMLLKSHDPENPVVESFEAEFNEIIDGYRSGNIQLPNAITQDSSKGVIREVSVNASSDLRPIELKGNYNSSGFDLIKVKVITGGVIGTATYSVWVKDSDGLKNNQIITADKITGDFDSITGSLYLRWAGDDDSAIVTADDEWEIDVHGYDCSTTTSQVGTISLTRR